MLPVLRQLGSLLRFSSCCLFWSVKASEELAAEESCSTAAGVGDIEDLSAAVSRITTTRPVVSVSGKRKNPAMSDEDLRQSWRTVLGAPPPMGHSHVCLPCCLVCIFVTVFFVGWFLGEFSRLYLLSIWTCIYMLSPPDSVGKDVVFSLSVHYVRPFVCLFICLFDHLSGQILLPQYLMNGLSNLNVTDREYTLLMIWLDSGGQRSILQQAVEVKSSTLTLGRRSPSSSWMFCAVQCSSR